MRMVLIATGLFIGGSVAGHADTPWSGFHVGAGVGMTGFGQLLDTRSAIVNDIPQTLDDPRRITGHVFGGYRWHNGAMVWGAEIAAQGGTASFETSPCVDGPAPCAAAGLLGELSTTGRLRLTGGYLVDDRTLLFASVGIAAARARIDGVYAVLHAGDSSISAESPFADPVSGTAFGHSLGLGVEHLVSSRMSLRLGITHDRLTVWTTAGALASVGHDDTDGDSASAEAAFFGNPGFRNLGISLSAVYRF